MSKKIAYIFFGTSEFAVLFLDSLVKNGLTLPSLVVTNPDRPRGRGLLETAPPVKVWANKNSIKVLQPEKLDEVLAKELGSYAADFFLVVSYGMIMPKLIFDIPPHKTFNLHPSLLPRYRGATPLESQLRSDEREIGVTLIQIDEKVDHGPIALQEKTAFDVWPIEKRELEERLAASGAKLFGKLLAGVADGSLSLTPQDDDLATFTKKINKEDGRVELDKLSYKDYLTFLALKNWPRTYFVLERKTGPMKVIITEATFKDGVFKTEKVIPEGKKEMAWEIFERAYLQKE